MNGYAGWHAAHSGWLRHTSPHFLASSTQAFPSLNISLISRMKGSELERMATQEGILGAAPHPPRPDFTNHLDAASESFFTKVQGPQPASPRRA